MSSSSANPPVLHSVRSASTAATASNLTWTGSGSKLVPIHYFSSTTSNFVTALLALHLTTISSASFTTFSSCTPAVRQNGTIFPNEAMDMEASKDWWKRPWLPEEMQLRANEVKMSEELNDKLQEDDHNNRSNAGQDGTSTGRGGRSDRGWWRSHEDARRGKLRTSDALDKIEKPIARGEDRWVQSQDEPSKTNDDRAQQPTKKKFREEKPPPAEKAAAEAEKAEGGPAGGGDRREERGIHRYAGRNERDRANAGSRLLPNRARPERGGFPSRDRFRGQEGYIRRQGFGGAGGGGSGGRVDKWKHDMFDEVNRSPTSKNEEDAVAKAEALLAL